MPQMPRERSPESTLALIRDPYRFISRRCRDHGSDVFRARILLHDTICMSGRDCAELFCDPSRFQRAGAAPERVQKTLFGQGGVQGLDDEGHRHRKAMFLALVVPERVAQLEAITGRWWEQYLGRWEGMGRVNLYEETHRLLTQAVCEWAGVPLPEAEVDKRTRELTALFDAAGDIGPRNWRARVARRQAERWAARLIEAVRDGSHAPPEDSAAYRVAWHRELDGNLLTPKIAAVELLNVLRPTVAVAVYIVFAATALHHYPEHRERLRGDPDYARWFVQEVRRFYPFFPAVTAIVRDDFEWRGYAFAKETAALLDLYGTNRDARKWVEPETFRPERFADPEAEDPYALVPQGGGDERVHHRCPGEPISIALTRQAAEFLVGAMHYELPEQDLTTDFKRTPALPRSGFFMTNVRPVTAGYGPV